MSVRGGSSGATSRFKRRQDERLGLLAQLGELFLVALLDGKL